MTTKAKTMSSKILEKFYSNDSLSQQFLGIFSAHYCWPSDCEQELRPKCWSQVMVESEDWFAAKLWPKVVSKVPLITGSAKTDQQFNELLFALVLKELDLLTVSESKYFESILDLFNDEITFGLMFWLKICFQFNWRLIYTKLIVSHKHSKQLIRTLVEELEQIESKSSYNCFTAEDINYFYSLIECICIESMANSIVNDLDNNQKNNQFFGQIFAKCLQKLVQKSYDPFVKQLYAFNVLTQHLIGFVFKLIANDVNDNELTQIKLNKMCKLFDETSLQLETNSEIAINNKKVFEDIAIARDNQKSLDLVNKWYVLSNNSKLELSSLKRFYEFIDNKTDESIQSKRFHYLTNILNDEQNQNYKQLIEILITFANFSTFQPLLQTINIINVQNFNLMTKLAKRVMKSSKEDLNSKKFFTAFLNKSLNSLENIDLKSRLNELSISRIAEPNSDVIKTLFSQITIEENSEESTVFDDLCRELLIGVYLDPFAIYNLLLDLALHHNKALIGLVAKLISNQLYCLSTFHMSCEEKETFLMKFIVHKLSDKPSIQLVEDMTKLIEQIVSSELDSESELDRVLPLDELFFYLVRDDCLVKSDVVWIKLLLMKNIIELSSDHKWSLIQSDPVPTIAYIMQFLDYFWRTPNRKQLVVDVLDLILNQKMSENLTEDELLGLDELLSKRVVQKASSHRIYLAYCEKRFPKPIQEVIDIRNRIFHDQILHYAVIAQDFNWICEVYPNYEMFSNDTKIALIHILPSLLTQEWLKLFKFLQMYYYNNIVISLLRYAILKTSDPKIDKMFLIQNLLNIVFNEILIPMRTERLERPLTYEDSQYVAMDSGVMFKTLSTLDYQFLTNELTIRLVEILTELAERMKFERMNAYGLYASERDLPPIARQVLKTVFGFGYPLKASPLMYTPLPAGFQSPNKVSNISVSE